MQWCGNRAGREEAVRGIEWAARAVRLVHARPAAAALLAVQVALVVQAEQVATGAGR